MPNINTAASFYCEGRPIAFGSDIAHHASVGGTRTERRDIYLVDRYELIPNSGRAG